MTIHWFAATVACLLMVTSALACGGLDMAVAELGSFTDSMNFLYFLS